MREKDAVAHDDIPRVHRRIHPFHGDCIVGGADEAVLDGDVLRRYYVNAIVVATPAELANAADERAGDRLQLEHPAAITSNENAHLNNSASDGPVGVASARTHSRALV